MIFNWFSWFKSFFDRIENPTVVVTENHAIFLDPVPTVENMLDPETKVEDNLETMSKPELLAEAKQRNIKAYIESRKRKNKKCLCKSKWSNERTS